MKYPAIVYGVVEHYQTPIPITVFPDWDSAFTWFLEQGLKDDHVEITGDLRTLYSEYLLDFHEYPPSDNVPKKFFLSFLTNGLEIDQIIIQEIVPGRPTFSVELW